MTIGKALKIAITEGSLGINRPGKHGYLRPDRNKYLRVTSSSGVATNFEYVPTVDDLVADDWYVVRKT